MLFMAEISQTGFINSGLQADLYRPAEFERNLAKTSPSSSQSQQDTVTISPQAQLLNKNADVNNARQSRLFDTNEGAPDTQAATDSVRVSSSIGEAASSVGLTEQEAIKLYQSIKDLL